MRVNLRKWIRSNKIYVIVWISMGLVTLWLIIRELGIHTLILILPFLPLLGLALARMARELRV